MKFMLCSFLFCFLCFNVFAQSIAINDNGSAPHSSAILDINSNNKGLLIPRITSGIYPINPTPGLMIYDTNSFQRGFKVFEQGMWHSILTDDDYTAIWYKSNSSAFYNGQITVGSHSGNNATFTVNAVPNLPIFTIYDESQSLAMSLEEDFKIFPNGGKVAIGYPYNESVVSRLQVNPLGSLNNNGSIDLTKSGFMVGNTNIGILMDANQIEGIGSTTFLNLNSSQKLSLGVGGGYVGIGVQNPSVRLDVLDDDWQVKVHNDNEINNNSWYLGSTGPTWQAGEGKFLISPETASNAALLTLDEGGYIGIGTNSPENRLHVEGGTNLTLTSGGFLQLGQSTDMNLVMDNNEISARDDGGASKLILNRDSGNVEIGFVTTGIGKLSVNSEPSESTVEFTYGGSSRFKVGTNGGVVLGGDTNTSHSREVMIDLGVPSKIRFQRDASDSQILMLPSVAAECNIGAGSLPFGRIYSNLFYANNSSSYLTYSDRRIKENIQPISDALEILNKLNSVRYEIKEEQYYLGKVERNDELVRKNQAGFIAQELEKILPQLVKSDEVNGLKSVAYLGLIPYLVEAVQALDQKNKDLENVKQTLADMKTLLLKQQRIIDELRKKN